MDVALIPAPAPSWELSGASPPPGIWSSSEDWTPIPALRDAFWDGWGSASRSESVCTLELSGCKGVGDGERFSGC